MLNITSIVPFAMHGKIILTNDVYIDGTKSSF